MHGPDFSEPGWIVRTLPTDFKATVVDAGKHVSALHPKTSTLYRTDCTDCPMPLEGWKLGWGHGPANLEFTDQTLVDLMKRAKALFDPLYKINPGALGIV